MACLLMTWPQPTSGLGATVLVVCECVICLSMTTYFLILEMTPAPLPLACLIEKRGSDGYADDDNDDYSIRTHFINESIYDVLLLSDY